MRLRTKACSHVRDTDDSSASGESCGNERKGVKKKLKSKLEEKKKD